MDITRSKIKSIGKKLRATDSSNKLSPEDLDVLTKWRDSHGASLNYLLRILEKELTRNGLLKNEYSLTQRLKRIYSIKLKLARFSNMQLSMMDDIAGARAIVNDIEGIDKLYHQ